MALVTSTTVLVTDLSPGQREQMFRLMDANYLGVDRQTFAADLSEKESVFLLKEGDSGAVVGFSTVMMLDLAISSGPVKGVFSGDTIVAQEYRRTTGLGVELGRCFRALLQQYPGTPIYWVLTSKGCRTYRLLPFLFLTFSPCYDRPTPPLHRQVRDAFGANKYPQEYDAGTGLVRYRGEAQRLRPGVAEATPERMSDPHTRFFVQVNPEHMRGDDLVCVAEVAEANFSRGFRRLLG